MFKVIAFSLVFCLLFNSMAFAEGPITKALNGNPIQGQIYEVPQEAVCQQGGRLARSHDDDRGRGDDGAVAEGRGLDDPGWRVSERWVDRVVGDVGFG